MRTKTETATKAAGTERVPSSTGPAATEITQQIDELVFDCERLSFYHSVRCDWFERSHRWAMFLVVFSGTSAFAAIVSVSAGLYLMLLPAALGLLDLTFNLSGRAREHSALYQRFCWLRGALLAEPESIGVLARAQQDIHAIYADEPPAYRALEAWGHNLACVGRGANRKHQLVIPRWHVALKNVWPFQGADYRLMG